MNQLGQTGLEERLKTILAAPHWRSGYTAGNILNLLAHLGGNLAGYDFSGLVVRQAYLRGVQFGGLNLAGANLVETVFIESFGNVFGVAFSPDGEWVAAGTSRAELLLWKISNDKPEFIWPGHSEGIAAVVFSPNGRWLASGGEDQAVRLWDICGCRSLPRRQSYPPGANLAGA